MKMSYRVEIEQEEDGRFLAEVVDLPGVMAYGETAEVALAHVQALALRVLADRLDNGEGAAGPRECHLRDLGRRVSRWRSMRASRVFAALQRIGWSVKREAKGSHKVLQREGFPDFVWAFHDRVEIGPRMLARIAKRTGLSPEDM